MLARLKKKNIGTEKLLWKKCHGVKNRKQDAYFNRVGAEKYLSADLTGST